MSFPQKVDTIICRLRPLGTIWNYLERPKGYWNCAKRYYPYSKMCELCELLERKIPPLSRWDLLISSQQNLFVTFGLFRRRLMSDIVRLLERAEESCEGLKHGYYDLPCVYFLIFLCHSGDIRLVRCLASPPSRLQNHRR